MVTVMKSMYLFIPILFLILSSCMGPGSQYSEDPEIAATQNWARQCSKIDTFLVDATALIRSDNMSDAGVDTVKRVATIYDAVCLSGEPEDMAQNLQDSVVREAIGNLCPNIVTADDAVVTILQATDCAVKNAILSGLP